MGGRLSECLKEINRLKGLVDDLTRSVEIKTNRISELSDSLLKLQKKYDKLSADFELWHRVALKFMKLFGVK